MKTRMQIRIQAAKRTLLGRSLCRLAGEQTGAVMMKYVILAVLVAAAAAVVGVTIFGKQVVNGMGLMMSATSDGAPMNLKTAVETTKDTTFETTKTDNPDGKL